MIDASEHFYHDDPTIGPEDVRTKLKDVEYFFLGNGLIQGAVQWAPSGEGSPLGLLVMNPNRLRKKRDAVTMDPRNGLASTLVQFTHGGVAHTPRAGRVRVAWDKTAVIPTVVARWSAGVVRVIERFSCPTWRQPRLCREITLTHTGKTLVTVEARTGVKNRTITRRVTLAPRTRRTLILGYSLVVAQDRVRLAWLPRLPQATACASFWRGMADICSGDRRLDHFYRAARAQLPVAVSRSGCIDGSIWQYNLEWLRDQSMVALALTLIGATELARTVFRRLLTKFVTAEGDTLDSSERRNPADVELDQNGLLLSTLKDYVLWTGDVGIVRDYWRKIVAVAEFPLRRVFRHQPSGLLANRREFWERHRMHGIQPGMELSYQVYVAHGLAAAAVLARLTGHPVEAERWAREGATLQNALLNHPRYRMHDARGFIKRRSLDGRVQETITPRRAARLPTAVPLGGTGRHFLNPDAAAALPIALGMVPARSPLARRTLRSLETLWNQAWITGGYGRYHVTSEPDSPGGWPFASWFIARAALEAGDDVKVWRVIDWLDAVPGAKAGTWFEFYGQRLAPPFPQVGIVVWNWAETIIFHVQHVLGIRLDETGLTVRPKLPCGVKTVRASLTWRGQPLTVKITRGQSAVVTVKGQRWPADG